MPAVYTCKIIYLAYEISPAGTKDTENNKNLVTQTLVCIYTSHLLYQLSILVVQNLVRLPASIYWLQLCSVRVCKHWKTL